MRLTEFNSLDRAAAVDAIRPALDIPRWFESVVEGRPYPDHDALLETAQAAASPLRAEEIERALDHHPRIGERSPGDSAEATLSRAEQAAVDPSDVEIRQRLLEGNRAYEERFGRVFLIRAAGRSPQEILANLSGRMANGPDEELAVVADQLRQIALLRLEGLVTP
ncbi:2-oxo-4-hydroxy-4-carboxy-5-ureidoimidazoline decarboxylase [Citricoccus sp.]|uniref:2-oxo-4-hydroxy-4-carboxy-5-ureidoimidazoline decarboxylase n=1 Tax=Citricoccus sp. TaxID=1978372 RepID=UPI0028BEFB9D|nr:2-oxo-4-hydroxy-4-carboxy-5-ureidoimidazoline decarboxylase [Citricoccus sp.]